MTDITESLRALTVNDATTSTLAVCEVAAREIERLRAAIAEARDYINCHPWCPARINGGRCECQQETANNILAAALDKPPRREE